MLQFMGSQRVRHDLVTEQRQSRIKQESSLGHAAPTVLPGPGYPTCRGGGWVALSSRISQSSTKRWVTKTIRVDTFIEQIQNSAWHIMTQSLYNYTSHSWHFTTSPLTPSIFSLTTLYYLIIRKDSDAGKDWKQEEKGTTEDKMVGWHHRLNGHQFGRALGVGIEQGGLACGSSWCPKELDTTERLNWTTLSCYKICLWFCHKVFQAKRKVQKILG